MLMGGQVIFNSPITSDVVINNLAGTSKAYVCVTPNGKLYRSTTACPQSTPPAQQYQQKIAD